MKVDRASVGFRPIHIILETDDEAKLMWLVLNFFSPSVESGIKVGYIQPEDEKKLNPVGHQMWGSFDKVFGRSSLRGFCMRD